MFLYHFFIHVAVIFILLSNLSSNVKCLFVFPVMSCSLSLFLPTFTEKPCQGPSPVNRRGKESQGVLNKQSSQFYNPNCTFSHNALMSIIFLKR